MPGFNPEPSAIAISRMLNRHVPQVRLPQAMPVRASGAGLRIPRLGRQIGGPIPDSPAAPFTGPIVHPSGGRADDVPAHVPQGSYVIPADIVSHIGEGNTFNGLAVLKMMFSPHPWQATAGPWGSQVFPMPRGSGPPKAVQPRVGGFPRFQVGPGVAQNVVRPDLGGLDEARQKFGGQVAGSPAAPATPVMLSGGEFVVSPQEVMRRGGGNISKGHKILDHWVKSLRRDHIQTLEKLPGPAK